MKNPLERYIKDNKGTKTEMHVTSVNITEHQRKFLEDKNINLSLVVRDRIEQLIKASSSEDDL